MSSKSATGYHLQCSGKAADTAAAHQDKNASIQAYFACFCPFVQRAWISLEYIGAALTTEEARAAGIDYQYVEVDPYKKPQELLDISPKGLVPAFRLSSNRSLHDSIILMHYLSSLTLPDKVNQLLPSDPYWKAKHLLAGQKHAESITPAFYRYLQAQDGDKQVQHGQELISSLESFEKEMHPDGPFFFGKDLSWVDILIAPWAIRFKPVLKHYRGFWPPLVSDQSRRFSRWYEAIQVHPAVQATTSTDDLYTDSYHRYANNIPNLSQVADAINSGRPLP